ncbi:MAG: ABC transporter permease subunit [Thermoplasmata archaeon]
MTSFQTTVLTIFRKEMWEHFRTKRLIVIGAIFAFVFIVISLYGGILSGQGSSELAFKAGANSVLGVVLSFTSFFPGIMAIVISYTSIAGERSRKSLILILSKPVRRGAVFLGKFLSCYAAIALVYIVVVTAGYVCVVAASGKAPSAEEVARAYGAVAFVLGAMACWVAFTLFLSSSLKNPLTVALSALMVWFLVMPIVSNIGMIYWMVSSEPAGSEPEGVDAALLQTQGQGSTVIFTGGPSLVFTLQNETTRLEGQMMKGYYTISGVPPGSYQWSARGRGVELNGTLTNDGVHGFMVSYDSELRVSVAPDVCVTLLRRGEPVQPSAKSEQGMSVNYTFSGELGECELVISVGEAVLFSGGYELLASSGEPFSQWGRGGMPDYVRYNQLINPDNAMTGYQEVLSPGTASISGISPGEGAAALAAFFVTFFLLGLYVFSTREMI